MTSRNNDTQTVSTIINAVREVTRQERRNNLLQATREAFRPENRGRKRNKTWKKSIFLLRRSNPDFYPSPNECSFLKKCGFGKKEAEISRLWSINKLNSYICQLYANIPLEDSGFRFGKVNKEKQIKPLPAPSSVRELENMLSRSLLLIIPNRDLPNECTYDDSQRSNDQDDQMISDDSDFEYIPRTLNFNSRNNMPRESTAILHSDSNSENRNHNDAPIPGCSYQERERGTDTFLDLNSVWDDITASSDNEASDFNLQFPTVNDENNIIPITIRRDNILHEMLKLYQEDETLPQKPIKVVFAEEVGLDYGGLTKELFSEFWKKVEADFFKGEDCIIPHLSLSNIRKGQDEHFLTIGKILAHTLVLTKSIPIKISRCVYLKLGNLERKISKNILKEDFFNFLTTSEKNLLKKAETSFNALTARENEALMDFFQTYGLYEIPKESEISEQIITIAENILCVESLNFIKKLKNGIPLFCEDFFLNLNEDNINCLFRQQAVTPGKFLQCLITEPNDLNCLQNKTYYFFKTYIKNLTKPDFFKLLLFITGSQHMPDCVTIFFKNSGFPVAHTCSDTLEIPTTYGTYQELSRQFDAILHNELSFQYTIS